MGIMKMNAANKLAFVTVYLRRILRIVGKRVAQATAAGHEARKIAIREGSLRGLVPHGEIHETGTKPPGVHSPVSGVFSRNEGPHSA